MKIMPGIKSSENQALKGRFSPSIYILLLPKKKLFLSEDEKMMRFERLKTHQHLASLTAILAALLEITLCMDACNVPYTVCMSSACLKLHPLLAEYR